MLLLNSNPNVPSRVGKVDGERRCSLRVDDERWYNEGTLFRWQNIDVEYSLSFHCIRARAQSNIVLYRLSVQFSEASGIDARTHTAILGFESRR